MIKLTRLFTTHPDAVGESYVEHMFFAWRFSGRLLRASFAAFVHGIVPAAYETAASEAVLNMAGELRERRAQLMSANREATGPASA